MNIRQDVPLHLDEFDLTILGAGFSACVTNGDAPLMCNFFGALETHNFPHLLRFLNQTFPDYRSANVEEVLIALDQISTCPKKLKKTLFSHARDHHREIRAELCRYCIRRLSGLNPSTERWGVQLLASLNGGCTVLTTNYDNIAERILSSRTDARHGSFNPTCHHCRMRQLLLKACGCSVGSGRPGPDWHGALIKLHGSIAWTRCTNRACCNFECLSPDEHCQPIESVPCDHCHESCSPVIVLPSLAKHLNEYPEIYTMWNCADEALAATHNVLVFGFSFPVSDALFSQTIRDAFLQNQNLKSVAVIDLKPEAVLTRIAQLLPKDRHVELISFPIPALGNPSWFQLHTTLTSTVVTS